MRYRNKIIKEFTNCESSILVSARVLNEGINIPIVDAITFVDYRSSTVDIIQCIGRALRLHDKKKLAKIYIPIFVDDVSKINENLVIGNIIRILKSLNETDNNINEYFSAINNGKSYSRKMILYNNFMSTEKFGEDIDIKKWIDDIKTNICKNIIGGKYENNKESDNIIKYFKNKRGKYNCKKCNYSTPDKSNFNRHIKSILHLKKEQIPTNNIIKNENIININIDENNPITISKSKYKCGCSKIFAHPSSFSRHKKSCNGINAKTEIIRISNEIQKIKQETNILRKIKQETEIPQKNNMVNSDDNLQKESIKSYIQMNYLNAPIFININDYSNFNNDECLIDSLYQEYSDCNLHKYFGDFIINQYKKGNPKKQSIWCSDISALTFLLNELTCDKKAIWKHDLKGVKITEYIINPLLDCIKENISKYLNNLTYDNTTYCKEKSDQDMIIAKIYIFIDSKAFTYDILNYIAPSFKVNTTFH